MGQVQLAVNIGDFFSKESLTGMFNDEESALIRLHLGISPELMAFSLKVSKILSEFLEHLSFGLVNADKIYPSLPHVLFGIQDSNYALVDSILRYAALAKNKTDGTGILLQGADLVGNVMDGELETPQLPDEIWLSHPETSRLPDTADGEHGVNTLMIFPPVSPCPPGCTQGTTCGEGVTHKGLFYLDNAVEKTIAFSQALKDNQINAKRRERRESL